MAFLDMMIASILIAQHAAAFVFEKPQISPEYCRALSDTCYSRAPSWVSASAYHVVQDFTNLGSGVRPEKLSSEIEDVILNEFEDVEVSCMFSNRMDPSKIMCTMQLPSDAVLAKLNRAATWRKSSFPKKQVLR